MLLGTCAQCYVQYDETPISGYQYKSVHLHVPSNDRSSVHCQEFLLFSGETVHHIQSHIVRDSRRRWGQPRRQGRRVVRSHGSMKAGQGVLVFFCTNYSSSIVLYATFCFWCTTECTTQWLRGSESQLCTVLFLK